MYKKYFREICMLKDFYILVNSNSFNSKNISQFRYFESCLAHLSNIVNCFQCEHLSNVKACNTSSQFTLIYRFTDIEKGMFCSNVNQSMHFNYIGDMLICEIGLENTRCLFFSKHFGLFITCIEKYVYGIFEKKIGCKFPILEQCFYQNLSPMKLVVGFPTTQSSLVSA